MAILYALVARGTVVLAEFSTAAGNANTIARRILENLPAGSDSRFSYAQDRHIFHVLRVHGIVYMCMASQTFGRSVTFAFLEDVSQTFSNTYGHAAHTSLAYAMYDEFSRVLHQKMEFYSNDSQADIIKRVKGEISDVKAVMVQNIDKILERGDRLELLVDKTAHIQENAFRFKKQARRMRRTQWVTTLKLMACLLVTILLVVYLVGAYFCGGVTLRSCI